MKSKRRRWTAVYAGGVWPKQVSTPTRPLTRCYVALRRRYSHVSHREPAEGSDLLSAEIGSRAAAFSRDWSSLGAKGTGEKLSPTWPTRTGGIWKSWERDNELGPPSISFVFIKNEFRKNNVEQILFFFHYLKIINNNKIIRKEYYYSTF